MPTKVAPTILSGTNRDRIVSATFPPEVNHLILALYHLPPDEIEIVEGKAP